MNRFLSEIQGKYMKLAKIVKISISFNRLVFPAILNDLTNNQPLDIFLYWNISMNYMQNIFISHLLMLTYFLCWKCSRISILLLIIYWCWLFFMCKMFLSFSIDVYVIFFHRNISMNCMYFIFICYLLMLTYFCVENVPQFQYCFWLFTDVDVYVIFLYWNISMNCMHLLFIGHLLMLIYFLCGKYSRISILLLIIYWCWLFFTCKMFLSFSIDVYVIFFTETYQWTTCSSSSFLIYWCWHIFFVLKMFHNFKTAFDYLLMLIIFHVQNVLIIFDWCLCDFLVLKHINELHAEHLHFSFTDVDIFFVLKMFHNFNTTFDYLLMLTIFHVQNVLIILNWCLCDFLLLKHINERHILHLHLSFTDVDIFLSGKCSTISTLLLIIYWCWLFFTCKIFLLFSIDVYVIFLYWNISMNCTHFIFICSSYYY